MATESERRVSKSSEEKLAWREIAGRGEPFEPERPGLIMRGETILYPMYRAGYVIRGAFSEYSYARHFRRRARLVAGAKDAASSAQTPD